MKLKLIGLAAASMLAFSVQASDVPYSYGEISYQSLDSDGVDADGFAFGGSYDFGNQFYGFGEYNSYEVDDVNIDVSGFQLGAGYHYEVSPGVDLIGELAIIAADIDAGISSTNDTGFSVGIGLRSMISSNVELFGKAEYANLFNDGDVGFEFGGQYYFGNGFGVGASYETADEVDGFKTLRFLNRVRLNMSRALFLKVRKGNKMKLKLMGLVAASAMAFSVQASDLPYSFLDFGYTSAKISDEGESESGGGFKIAGSYDFGNSIYAFADYSSFGFDGGFDLSYSGLGAGYKYSIAPNTDLNFELAAKRLGFDVPSDSFFEDDSETGYGIGLGIRSMISPNFELGGKVERVDIQGSETFTGVNGAYYFGNGWGVSGEAVFAEDAFDTFAIKARYTF